MTDQLDKLANLVKADCEPGDFDKFVDMLAIKSSHKAALIAFADHWRRQYGRAELALRDHGIDF